MDDSPSPVDIELDNDIDINEQVSDQELESHESFAQEMHLELDDDVEFVEEREVEEDIAEVEPRIGAFNEENGTEEARTDYNDEGDEVLSHNVERIESDMEEEQDKPTPVSIELSPEIERVKTRGEYEEEPEGVVAHSSGEERKEDEELVDEKEEKERNYSNDEVEEVDAAGASDETNEYSDVEEHDLEEGEGEEGEEGEEGKDEEGDAKAESEVEAEEAREENDPEFNGDLHEEYEHDYDQINEPSNPNSPSPLNEEHATNETEANQNDELHKLPIIIDVADTEFLLVPFKAEDSSIDVSLLVPLFDTESVLELPIEEFFGLMRHNEDLNEIYKFSVDEELVLLFPQFDGLHLTEDNVYSREVTFNDFVSTFERLAENTTSEKPLSMACALTSQTRFITKFNGLAELIREQKGFESIAVHESTSTKRPTESPTSAKKRQRLSID
jgi:hypothetical protein